LVLKIAEHSQVTLEIFMGTDFVNFGVQPLVEDEGKFLWVRGCGCKSSSKDALSGRHPPPKAVAVGLSDFRYFDDLFTTINVVIAHLDWHLKVIFDYS
jgi:hypothetical protein